MVLLRAEMSLELDLTLFLDREEGSGRLDEMSMSHVYPRFSVRFGPVWITQSHAHFPFPCIVDGGMEWDRIVSSDGMGWMAPRV